MTDDWFSLPRYSCTPYRPLQRTARPATLGPPRWQVHGSFGTVMEKAIVVSALVAAAATSRLNTQDTTSFCEVWTNLGP